MQRKWVVVVILALTILPAMTVRQARGETVNISVAPDTVTVNMNLALVENLTSLPQVDTHISSANSTTILQPLLQPISDAIQRKVPGASVSNIDISIRTINNTKSWSLEENYSLTIVGANSNSGSRVTSRLDFVSMNVSQPLQIGGLEFNEVGPAILYPALQEKANLYSNLQYYIDGSSTRNSVIPGETTKRFLLLDFTWISPVSTWTNNANILGHSTTWTYHPGSSRYNLTLGLPSPEGPLLASYIAIYGVSMSITVPANAWVNGNTIYFDTPTPIETLMPAIAVAFLVIALVAFVADRRIGAPYRARRKRKLEH